MYLLYPCAERESINLHTNNLIFRRTSSSRDHQEHSDHVLGRLVKVSRSVEGGRIQACLETFRERLASLGSCEFLCCGQAVSGDLPLFDYIKITLALYSPLSASIFTHGLVRTLSLAKFTALFAYFRHGFHWFGILRHVCCRATSTMEIFETFLCMLNTIGGYTSAHPIHTLHLLAHTYVRIPKHIRKHTRLRMHICMYNGGDVCAEEEAGKATLRGRILLEGWIFEIFD